MIKYDKVFIDVSVQLFTGILRNELCMVKQAVR